MLRCNCPLFIADEMLEVTTLNTNENVLVLINKGFSKMSKGQKQIAIYLTEHYNDAAFQTAAQIANEAQVSESTVVRFASYLGYDGFPQLHHALEQLIARRLDVAKKIEFSKEHSDRGELIRQVLQSDIAKLEDTLESLDPTAVDIAVDNILRARAVYIIGLRSCAPLAESLRFYLHAICPHVVLLKSTSTVSYKHMTMPTILRV